MAKGKKQKEIADVIGRNKSVISREIKRNKNQRNGIYNDDLANRKYAIRQQNKPKHKRFTTEIKQYVENLIAEDYSPEQIVGVSKLQYSLCIS